MQARGLVIFDLDGTLFETARAIVPAVEQAFERHAGAAPTRAEILSFIGKPGVEFKAWLRDRTGRRDVEALLETIDSLELQYVAERGRLYPGVTEMLDELAAASVQLAICSNGTDPYVGRVLAAHGIDRRFDRVRHRRSGGDTKPRMVTELLGRLEGRPAMVVGDRGEDVEAARANGLASIAALHGYGSAAELAGADAAARTASEMLQQVRRVLDA